MWHPKITGSTLQLLCKQEDAIWYNNGNKKTVLFRALSALLGFIYPATKLHLFVEKGFMQEGQALASWFMLGRQSCVKDRFLNYIDFSSVIASQDEC